MALTNVAVNAFSGVAPGTPLQIAEIEVDPDTSYVTGGYLVASLIKASEAKLAGVTWFYGKSLLHNGTWYAVLDPATQKIQFFTTADDVEVVSTTDLDALNDHRMLMIGY